MTLVFLLFFPFDLAFLLTRILFVCGKIFGGCVRLRVFFMVGFVYIHAQRALFSAKNSRSSAYSIAKETERFRVKMEGGKKSGSSLTNDLFGSKDSDVAASSSGILGSIFGPPAKTVANDFLNTAEKERKRDSGSQSWNSKTAVSESNAVNSQGNFQRSEGKDIGSFCPVENVHPCHYSSSIYYGGQDVYSRPQTSQSTVFTTFNKDGGEDDSDGASRGNWWQGSLYY